MFNFMEAMFGSSRPRPPTPEDRAEESINRLHSKASMFILLFEKHHHSMLQNVQICRRMSERIKQHKYTLKACLGFSALLGVLTIILTFAIILHPIHSEALHFYWAIYRGISEERQERQEIREIPIGLVILLMLAAPPVLFFILTQIEKVKIVCRVNASIRDFRRKVSLLNPKLEEVKRVCEELRRSSWAVLHGTDRVNIMRLERSVLEVFVLTEGLTLSASADSVTQVYVEYSWTLSELDKMQVQLSTYSGSAIIIESELVD